MTDNTQPETREFTMSQYASKDDMIAAMHARIAEMETQLEAIGAGGVSGPLMGQSQAMPHWMQYDERTDVLTIHGKRYTAGMFGEDGFLSPPGALLRVEDGPADCVTLTRVSLAANAESEPVATVFTMEALAPGGGVKYHATVHKPLPAGTKLYTHPYPLEGMVGGWMPIETAPKDGTEILGYTEEVGALVLYWDSMTGEMDHWSDGMSVSFWKPTHWMPLPPPATSSADSRKGD